MDPRLRTRALPSDLVGVYGLLEEASSWLRARGSAQWSSVYPIERFAREVAEGHVWYWGAGEEPIATVTLLPRPPDYYPQDVWNDGTPAWYLCRFAVKRALARRRVGESLLRQLEIDAAGQGLRALRLDVGPEAPFLQDYYRAHGFEDRGVVELMGVQSALLERLVRAGLPAQQ